MGKYCFYKICRQLIYKQAHYGTFAPHNVLLADNGNMGIELARQYKPDLIFLDLVMAQPDGRAVLQILKEDRVTRDIPVVMVTASIQEQDMKELQPLAQGFLRKPVSRSAIAKMAKKNYNV